MQKGLTISLKDFTHPKTGSTYRVIGTQSEPHTHDVLNVDTGKVKEGISHEIVKKWQLESTFV